MEIITGEQTTEVTPGMVLFVPAGERHRFHDIAEDLSMLVLFGPAEGSMMRPRDP